MAYRGGHSRFFRGSRGGSGSHAFNRPGSGDASIVEVGNEDGSQHHMRSRGRGSSTFATGETQTYQEFLVIRNAMRRLFKQSDVAQMKFQEYLAHKAAVAEANKKQSEIKLKAKAEEQDWVIPPVDIAPSEKGPQQNRGPVLDVPTIWCPNWRDGKDEIAPWPTLAEMKWEGDDRAKTGVGRYLPIPREIGAPSIHWNQLAAVEIYPLDRVREVPTMEDVYLPVDEIDDSLKYDLITPDLEEAINASCF